MAVQANFSLIESLPQLPQKGDGNASPSPKSYAQEVVHIVCCSGSLLVGSTHSSAESASEDVRPISLVNLRGTGRGIILYCTVIHMYCLTNSQIYSACCKLNLSRNILAKILCLTNPLECQGVAMPRVVVRRFLLPRTHQQFQIPKNYAMTRAVLAEMLFCVATALLPTIDYSDNRWNGRGD
jgi:hypothetical protein